jgi:hypothetical protein
LRSFQLRFGKTSKRLQRFFFTSPLR